LPNGSHRFYVEPFAEIVFVAVPAAPTGIMPKKVQANAAGVADLAEAKLKALRGHTLAVVDADTES
jgi:hypothetical protein